MRSKLILGSFLFACSALAQPPMPIQNGKLMSTLDANNQTISNAGNITGNASISVAGNITGNFILGNGSLLTGISGGGLPGNLVYTDVANQTITGNLLVTTSTTDGIDTITSVINFGESGNTVNTAITNSNSGAGEPQTAYCLVNATSSSVGWQQPDGGIESRVTAVSNGIELLTSNTIEVTAGGNVRFRDGTALTTNTGNLSLSGSNLTFDTGDIFMNGGDVLLSNRITFDNTIIGDKIRLYEASVSQNYSLGIEPNYTVLVGQNGLKVRAGNSSGTVLFNNNISNTTIATALSVSAGIINMGDVQSNEKLCVYGTAGTNTSLGFGIGSNEFRMYTGPGTDIIRFLNSAAGNTTATLSDAGIYTVTSGISTPNLTITKATNHTVNSVAGGGNITSTMSFIKLTSTGNVTVFDGTDGAWIQIKNYSGGAITLLPTGAETFDGNASLTLNDKEAVDLTSDGTDWMIH